MRGKFFKSALFTLILAASQSSATSVGKPGGAKPLPLPGSLTFPTPACEVNAALPALKSRLSEMPSTSWDGDLPWPFVLGHWMNTIRDLYMVVYVREIPGARYGVAHVYLRSICTDQILAYGAKPITEKDFTRPYLTVRLRNLALNGSRLAASIRVPALGSRNVLEVKVHKYGTDAAAGDEEGLQDWFLSEKLN